MSKAKKILKKVKSGYLKEAWFELKWIYELLGPYRSKILIYIIFSLIAIVLSLFLDFQIKDIVTNLIDLNFSELIDIGIIYLIFGGGNIAIIVITQVMSGRISNRAKKDISNEIYHKILNSDWESLNDYQSGDFINRMNEDIASIADSFVDWIPGIMTKGLQILVAFSLIVYYDYTMLIIFLIVAPIIVLGSKLFIRNTYTSNKLARIKSSEVTSFRNESFHNIQMVKAFGLIKPFDGLMQTLQAEKCEIDIKVKKYSVASWAVMYLSSQVAALLCLVWGVYHVYTGVITFGVLSLMFLMASNIASSFKAMIQLIPKAVSTITSATRVRNITELDEEHNIDVPKTERILAKAQEQGLSLNLENIDFNYRNGNEVFKDVSFEVEPGEIVALVGPSGEGKTTMLRIILGIVKIKKGRFNFSIDHNIDDTIEFEPATRKFIGYVPQENVMLTMTIAENMRLVKPQASDEEIIEALKVSCAYDFVSTLPDGINHPVGEGGAGFSEGQKQRLSIARALLCDAPMLLLDEATSALDVATERKLLKKVMIKYPNRSCILTTHRPSVLTMCDKVYRVSGKTVRQIDAEEITKLMDGF